MNTKGIINTTPLSEEELKGMIVGDVSADFGANVKDQAPRAVDDPSKEGAPERLPASACYAIITFEDDAGNIVDEWNVEKSLLETEDGLETLFTRILNYSGIERSFARIRSSGLARIGKGKQYIRLVSSQNVESNQVS